MIRFTICTLPPSLNQLERMHWAVKKKIRARLADEICLESGCLPEPGSKPIPRKFRLATTIYWKTRRLDEDNAMGSLKILIDAMRDVGLIYRDSPKWLKVDKPIQKLDHKNPRVEITIEELSGGPSCS